MVRSASHRCETKVRQVCGTCAFWAATMHAGKGLRTPAGGTQWTSSTSRAVRRPSLRMCQAPLVTRRSRVKHGARKCHVCDKPQTCCPEAWFIGPVAQWIRHRPTELGIAGASPAGVMSPPPPTMRRARRHSCAVNMLSCGPVATEFLTEAAQLVQAAPIWAISPRQRRSPYTEFLRCLPP